MSFGQATPPSEQLEAYLIQAPLIVEAVVGSETYAVRNRQSDFIETVHTLQVSQVLKGSLPIGPVEVHTPGGQLDGIIQSVSHGSSLGAGQSGIYMLTPNADGGYYLVAGNAGKITKLPYDDNYEAIHWGELTKYKSWRQLREEIGQSLGVDLSIASLTADQLSSITEDKTFCVKLDNPVPNIEDKTVKFDVLAKSSVPGLKFARAEILIDYPAGNLGEFIVDQEKIEADKAQITNSTAYTIEVNDQTKDQIDLTIESPCDNAQPHYVLDTVYEKLATLTVEVNEWGDLGTMNVNDFAIAGEAEYVNPASLQGTPGCSDFDDLCGEGEIGFVTCALNVSQTNITGAGVFDVVTLNGAGFGDRIKYPSATIEIPNADDGGMSTLTLSLTDSNHIVFWDSIRIEVQIGSIVANPDYGQSPMGSGFWTINPDPSNLSLSCGGQVNVDYALDNELVDIAGSAVGIRSKMVALARDVATSRLGTDYDWEYFIDTNVVVNNLLPNGIAIGDLERIFLDVLCDWEEASGIELTYGGLAPIVAGNRSFLTFETGQIGDDPGVTTIVNTSNGFCPSPISENVFGEIHRRSIIRIRDNYTYYIGSSASISSNEIDLQSVLLHEVGHSLLMRHENNPLLGDPSQQGCMYYTLGLGRTKRDIDTDAKVGISLERTRSALANEPNPLTCFAGYFSDVNLGTCTLITAIQNNNHSVPKYTYVSGGRSLTVFEAQGGSVRCYDFVGRLLTETKLYGSTESLQIADNAYAVTISDSWGGKISFLTPNLR